MDSSSDAALDSSMGRVIPPTELTDDSDQDDFGPSVEACVWSLAILAAGWLALRLYLKLRKHRGLWWDDHFLVIVSVVLSNISTSVAISLGWAKQPPDIDPKNWPRILLLLYIAGIFSILAAAISKTSFALTLLRISNGWVKCVVWFAISTVNVVMGLSIIFNWVQCTPLEKNFNIFLPGSCWPATTLIGYNAFVAAYSGVMDILLALLPWKIIWKMNMSRKERFGAICAMSLGFLAGIISFVKIYALTGTFHANLGKTHRYLFIRNKNDTLNLFADSSIQLTVLSIAETSITIMAASIPILRALARDKAGPRGIKLFTLNATEHITVQQESEPQLDSSDAEPNRTGETSRRLFSIIKKASRRRVPVLSNIIEAEEPSPELFEGTTTRERSFV
ncbi:hypothetical protein F4801DRAFT_571936 [Xylaria longipes]|nr:hypothetical protein F4801DRAFT_571936 [Xylaria longipes]